MQTSEFECLTYTKNPTQNELRTEASHLKSENIGEMSMTLFQLRPKSEARKEKQMNL